MKNWTSGQQPWYIVRDKITTVEFGDQITNIGSYAFEGTTGLKTIKWKNIKSIGSNAFTGCGIEDLTITKTINNIGTTAFGSCPNLKTLKYPITSITFTTDIFTGSTKLNTIEIYGTGSMQLYTHRNQPWNSIKNQIEIITFGEGIDRIGNYSFEETGKLKTINWGGVKQIGEQSFASSGLTNISISTKVTTIETNAFINCKSLTTVEYPVSATSYSTNIFEGCERLTSLKIIGEGPMKDCTDETDQPWYQLENNYKQ